MSKNAVEQAGLKNNLQTVALKNGWLEESINLIKGIIVPPLP